MRKIKRRKSKKSILQLKFQTIIYLSHLIAIEKYILKSKVKTYRQWLPKKEGWFFILNSELFKDLPFMNKVRRYRMDKILEELDLIKTKRAGPKARKYYKLKHKNIRNILLPHRIAPIETLFYYIFIYININKYNENFSSSSSLRKFSSSSPKNRLIQRRPIENIISHWSSLGPPFAEVRKKESIYPVLKKVIKSSQDREIIRVIDIAYNYMSHPSFIFSNGGKGIGIKSFFQRDKYNSYQTNFLSKNKFNSWFNLFQTRGPEWLDNNLVKIPKIKDKEVYSYLNNYLKADRPTIISASNKMAIWMEKNDYPLRTMTNDFENFMRDKYPNIRDFKVYWLKGSKFWNDQFARYLIQFGRFKSMDQINKI